MQNETTREEVLALALRGLGLALMVRDQAYDGSVTAEDQMSMAVEAANAIIKTAEMDGVLEELDGTHAKQDGAIEDNRLELFEDLVAVVLEGFNAAHDILQDHTYDPLDVN